MLRIFLRNDNEETANEQDLFRIPAYGHTNLTHGVASELTARSHEVRYHHSYEPIKTLIESRRRATRHLRPV